MEGAVRSGYLAAEAILSDVGAPQKFLRPGLPRKVWPGFGPANPDGFAHFFSTCLHDDIKAWKRSLAGRHP